MTERKRSKIFLWLSPFPLPPQAGPSFGLEPNYLLVNASPLCIMAAVLRSSCKKFSCFTVLISRNLHCCNKVANSNGTLTLKANPLGQFHKMSAFSTSAQRSSSLDMSGIFPPIVTPFEANEEVSYGKLTENFSKWNDIPFRGKIYLFQESELLAIDSLFL